MQWSPLVRSQLFVRLRELEEVTRICSNLPDSGAKGFVLFKNEGKTILNRILSFRPPIMVNGIYFRF